MSESRDEPVCSTCQTIVLLPLPGDTGEVQCGQCAADAPTVATALRRQGGR
ncbi:hypothetical protein [Prauserella flavalba]|uniref:hypothetical protein n=1 Tax=Prauserella flavalba TaxID=1477506 RepID=UPI0036ED9A57